MSATLRDVEKSLGPVVKGPEALCCMCSERRFMVLLVQSKAMSGRTSQQHKLLGTSSSTSISK